MKTKTRAFGILVLALVFVFASCKDDSSGGGSSSGNTLKLSGQVYQMNSLTMTLTKYTGSDMAITSPQGGSGGITNGNFSFTVGIPPVLETADASIDNDLGTYYSNISVTPGDTQGAALGFNQDLNKGNFEITNLLTMTGTIEMVAYMYVDKNCTVTATGKTFVESGQTITTSDINLKLKQGWNVLCVKAPFSGSIGTANISLKDPSSCKWIYGSVF
jgi:hypothetical protein